MMQYFFLFVISISFPFIACQDRRSVSMSDSNVIQNDIALYKNGKQIYAYTSISKAASQLNLDSLELGFDSMQIRIWFSFAKHDSSQIFIIKNRNNKWSAESIILKYLWDDTLLQTSLSDTITKVSYHNVNWTRFLNELFQLKITSLPDMDKINGYKDIGGIDGSGCCVEIATKSSYRFYGYWFPGRFKDQYWQADNMIKIIELLEREFSFKLLDTL